MQNCAGNKASLSGASKQDLLTKVHWRTVMYYKSTQTTHSA